jgi:hypothetical protein
MRAALSLLGPLNPPEGEAIATGKAPWQRYRDRRASGHRGAATLRYARMAGEESG